MTRAAAAVRAAVRALRRLSAPVAAQAVTAATSMVLQVVAARALGLAEFGAFAVLLGFLAAASAVYTGYVGDSLAVLDRHDAVVRGALVGSALTSWVLAAGAAAVTVVLLRGPDIPLLLAFSVLAVVWLVRETLRRLLIARMDFTRLLGNDVLYLVVTLAVLLVAASSGLTLTALVVAMAIGAVVTVGLGVLRVPRDELRDLRPGWQGMGRLAQFAGWRAAHATLRPVALLAVRVLVGVFGSLTAVGLLEAGRLVVAALQVVVNGAGSYLLPRFAAAEKQPERGRPDTARLAVVLAAGTLACGLVCAALAGPLGELLTGAPVPGWLVLGWSVYLAVWAAGLPSVAEVVARKLSRATFVVRLIDTVAGLALASVALAAGADVTVVPWLLAIGGCYAVMRLHLLAMRTRTTRPHDAPGRK